MNAQREAFRKILKKYTVGTDSHILCRVLLILAPQKWTGSKTLGERFRSEVLGDLDSFTRFDFNDLLSQYKDLSDNLRSSTPQLSESPSLSSSIRDSRRSSKQIPIQPERPQAYWNEYDNGSEAGENEPYTIYVDPDQGSFPGSKTMEYIFSKVKQPVSSVRSWFSHSASPNERRPLLPSRDSYFERFTENSPPETDAEDAAYASSNEFPSGYAAHYATLPSVNEQKFSRHREMLLFRAMIGAYAGSLMLIVITGILFATGRRKLMAEVDAGAVAGCIASLCFALAGIMASLYRKETMGLMHTICVWVAFVGLFLLNLMLLYLVMTNIRS